MPKVVEIGAKPVGEGHPAYVIAEIGLNHNGDVKIAKQLIDAAALAGCNAVKFQKRTPELCVPSEQRNIQGETPWGIMTYLDYRYRVEFGDKEFTEIDRYCKDKEIAWFASCWDEPSIDFIDRFNPPCYKVASASLTDDALLKHTRTSPRSGCR
jgi:N-acetylneuraminate synthase